MTEQPAPAESNPAEAMRQQGMQALTRLRDALRRRQVAALLVTAGLWALCAAATAGALALTGLCSGWWGLPGALAAGAAALAWSGRAGLRRPDLTEAALLADREAMLNGRAAALLTLAGASGSEAVTPVAARLRLEFLIAAETWLPALMKIRVRIFPPRVRWLLLPLALLGAEALLYSALTTTAADAPPQPTGWILRPATGESASAAQAAANPDANDPQQLRALELARRLAQLQQLLPPEEGGAGTSAAAGAKRNGNAGGDAFDTPPEVLYRDPPALEKIPADGWPATGELPPEFARQVEAYLHALDLKRGRQ